MNFRMAMPLIYGGIRADTIQVSLSVYVVEPDALRTLDNQIERMIVMSAIAILECDELPCIVLNVMHDVPCAPRVFLQWRGTAGARTPAFQEHL